MSEKPRVNPFADTVLMQDAQEKINVWKAAQDSSASTSAATEHYELPRSGLAKLLRNVGGSLKGVFGGSALKKELRKVAEIPASAASLQDVPTQGVLRENITVDPPKRKGWRDNI